jgi:hypothetical protein
MKQQSEQLPLSGIQHNFLENNPDVGKENPDVAEAGKVHSPHQ